MASTLNTAAVKQAIRAAAAKAVVPAAEHLIKASNALVPDDDGELQASGRVAHEGSEAAVIYDAEYAAIVHEDLTDEHDDGTAKFLEKARNQEAGQMAQIIADRMRKDIGS